MINFEDGRLVKGAYVLINGVEYPVVMPKYTGDTPVTSENLNKAQKDLKNEIDKRIGIVLFENPNGITKEIIILNDNISKYKRFKIVYGLVNTEERNIYEAEVTTNNKVHLQSEVVDASSRIYIIRYADLIVYEDSILIKANSYVNINHNTNPFVGNPTSISDYIAIYKVIGYKED